MKVVRNSTYKVGLEEWETNLPDKSSPMECFLSEKPYKSPKI